MFNLERFKLEITFKHILILTNLFQLISVNGIDFRIIDHYEAVKLLKESNEFLIVAKFSPFG